MLKKLKELLNKIPTSFTLCKPISYRIQSKKDIVPLHVITLMLPTIGIGLEKSFSFERENVLTMQFPTQLEVRRIPEIRYIAITVTVLGFGISFMRQMDY